MTQEKVTAHGILTTIRRAIVRANEDIERRIGPVRRPIMQDYLEVLARASPLLHNAQALHFGSGRDKNGTGQFVTGLGMHVVSLDIDPVGLELNPSKNKVLRTGARLPLNNNIFDLVFSEYVFEHLPDPWTDLCELDRVTKPGGMIAILVPNRKHYYALVTRLTPLWFHRTYLRLQGVPVVELDTFKTAHLWGSLDDVREVPYRLPWRLVELRSMPGPTEYTKWMPFHVLFVLLDKVLSRWQSRHLDYVVLYQKWKGIIK